MDECFCARSRGQRVLVRVALGIEVLGIVLCQAAGHQSPQEVADYQASHSSRRLLKGYQPAHADGGCYGIWYGGIG